MVKITTTTQMTIFQISLNENEITRDLFFIELNKIEQKILIKNNFHDYVSLFILKTNIADYF
jgi:hypothetical protein